MMVTGCVQLRRADRFDYSDPTSVCQRAELYLRIGLARFGADAGLNGFDRAILLRQVRTHQLRLSSVHYSYDQQTVSIWYEVKGMLQTEGTGPEALSKWPLLCVDLTRSGDYKSAVMGTATGRAIPTYPASDPTTILRKTERNLATGKVACEYGVRLSHTERSNLVEKVNSGQLQFRSLTYLTDEHCVELNYLVKGTQRCSPEP